MMMVVIDQYIVGIFVISLLGFILLFSLFRDVKSNSKKKDRRSVVGDLSEVDRSSDEGRHNSGEPDVIVVGAGVAGAALAYTLAKVMLMLHASFFFICFLFYFNSRFVDVCGCFFACKVAI